MSLNQAILLKMAELLGDKWAIPLIGELMRGNRRFGKLQQQLGINPRTLTNRLRRLEEAQFITRHVYHEAPPRVEYELTAKGRELIDVLEALVAFGERYLDGSVYD